MDKKVISCEFNIDTACVEVKYADGSMIAIDCTLVEAEVARNMYESSELEWLVYNTSDILTIDEEPCYVVTYGKNGCQSKFAEIRTASNKILHGVSFHNSLRIICAILNETSFRRCKERTTLPIHLIRGSNPASIAKNS